MVHSPPIHPGLLLSAVEARAGLRAVRRRGGCRASGGAGARRMACRQLFLALVLSRRRPGSASLRSRWSRCFSPRTSLMRSSRTVRYRRFLLVRLSSARSRSCLTAALGSLVRLDFPPHLYGHLRARLHLDGPFRGQPARADDRRAMVGSAPVRRLFPGDGGDRRKFLCDLSIPAAAGADDFGYTATSAGVLLTPGGLVTMVMMFVVGQIWADSSRST